MWFKKESAQGNSVVIDGSFHPFFGTKSFGEFCQKMKAFALLEYATEEELRVVNALLEQNARSIGALLIAYQADSIEIKKENVFVHDLLTILKTILHSPSREVHPEQEKDKKEPAFQTAVYAHLIFYLRNMSEIDSEAKRRVEVLLTKILGFTDPKQIPTQLKMLELLYTKLAERDAAHEHS